MYNHTNRCTHRCTHVNTHVGKWKHTCTSMHAHTNTHMVWNPNLTCKMEIPTLVKNIGITPGTQLNFFKNKNYVSSDTLSHQTMEKLIIEGKMEGQRKRGRLKISWEMDVEDWMRVNVWTVDEQQKIMRSLENESKQQCPEKDK